ncbi:MAG: hypothetical protein ACOZF0_22090 [Thermodesulfobacteriota bacterium]
MGALQKTLLLTAICLTMVWPASGFCDEMGTLMDEFGRAYEELAPSPNSSVNADYKLSQAALGGFYTTKSLGLIYRQNQKIAVQNEAIIEKYDKLIEQNNQIIGLLEIIAKGKNRSEGEE